MRLCYTLYPTLVGEILQKAIKFIHDMKPYILEKGRGPPPNLQLTYARGNNTCDSNHDQSYRKASEFTCWSQEN